jgi:hypothetical protein
MIHADNGISFCHGLSTIRILSAPRSGFVASHLLGDLELAAVLQVGGDAGGAEAVGADPGSQSWSACPPLDHHVHIGLGQGSALGQPAMAQGREEWCLGFAAEPGRRNPLLQILVKVRMAGKLGHLAALLVQPYPAAALPLAAPLHEMLKLPLVLSS